MHSTGHENHPHPRQGPVLGLFGDDVGSGSPRQEQPGMIGVDAKAAALQASLSFGTNSCTVELNFDAEGSPGEHRPQPQLGYRTIDEPDIARVRVP